MHLNDCPVQRKIPVFLIVMGVTGLVCLMLSYIRNTLEDGGISLLCSMCSIVCYTFIFCWFIAGECVEIKHKRGLTKINKEKAVDDVDKDVH